MAAPQSGEGGEAEGEAAPRNEAATEKRAKKGAGGQVALGHVAVGTAGDEVAIGIAAETGAGDDVVEHAERAGQAALTVETAAAVAGKNGAAIFRGLKEVHRFQILSASGAGDHAAGDFARKRNLDLVALITALANAQETLGAQAAENGPHSAAGKVRASGQGARGSVQNAATRQTTAADEVEVEDAVGGGESESRDEMVFNVGPETGGVGGGGMRMCALHVRSTSKEKGGHTGPPLQDRASLTV